MSRHIQFGSKDPGPIRWLEIKNSSGETIPPYSVMRQTGSSQPEPGSNVITVDKPDTSTGTYLVTSFVPVESGQGGVGTLDGPFIVAYDTTDTPAVGDEWGPVDGEWTLSKSGTGFVVMGNIESGAGTLLAVGKVQAGSKAILGTMDANVTATDSSFMGTVTIAFSGSIPTDPVSVSNTFGFKGDLGGTFYAVSEDGEAWKCIQMECPAPITAHNVPPAGASASATATATFTPTQSVASAIVSNPLGTFGDLPGPAELAYNAENYN